MEPFWPAVLQASMAGWSRADKTTGDEPPERRLPSLWRHSLSSSLLYVPRSSTAPFHPLSSCSMPPGGVISPPKGVPGGCGSRGPPVAAPRVVVVFGKGRGRGSAPPPARGGRAGGPRTGTLPEGGGTTGRQGRARNPPTVGGGLLRRFRPSVCSSCPPTAFQAPWHSPSSSAMAARAGPEAETQTASRTRLPLR